MRAIFKRIRNIIIYSFICGCIIIVGLYFLITSNFFLTKILTPYVGHLMGAEFVIENAEYDPFSSLLQFENGRLGDKDNPFIVAEYGAGYIDVASIFRNTLKLSNVYIRDIKLNFKQVDSGKWSIPWLYTKKEEKKSDSPGLQLDFFNVNINNLDINYHDKLNNDIVLKKLNFKSKYFKNGVMSLVEYSGEIESRLGDAALIKSGKISNEFLVNLDEDCIPAELNMSQVFSIENGFIGKTKIKNRYIKLDTEIKRQVDNVHSYDIAFLNIKDSVDTVNESYIDTDGVIRFEPFKLFLNIRGGPIRSPVLDIVYNLFGDFRAGDANLLYMGSILLSSSDFSSQGKMLLSSFKLATENFNLTEGLPLNVYQDYSLKLNFDKDTLTLDKSELSLSLDDKNIVSSHLNSPFTFNYKKGCLLDTKKTPDMTVNTRGLDLKFLNAFMEGNVRFFTGTLDSDMILSINCENNDINLNGITSIKDLSLKINGFDPMKLTSAQSLNFNMKNDASFKFNGESLNLNNFNIVLEKQKEGFKSDFILVSPLVFKIDKKGLHLNNDIKFDIMLDDFQIKKINSFLPYNFPLKFLEGVMKYKYSFTIPKTFDFFDLTGKGELLYCNMDVYGKRFNNLSISSKLGSVYFDTEKIRYDDCTCELYVHGVRGLKARTDGEIILNDSDDLNFEIAVDDINQYLFDIFTPGISEKFNKLDITGKFIYEYHRKTDVLSVYGNFNLRDSYFETGMVQAYKMPTYTGNLNFSTENSKDEFSIHDLYFNLKKNKSDILNINAWGGFPLPLKNGESSITVVSDCMAFDEVADIFYKLGSGGNKTDSKQVVSEEYSPIDLQGMNLKGDIKFNNIFCGDLIKAEYYGSLNINDNNISLTNENFNLNGTKFKFDSNINVGATDGYDYRLKTSFKNFDMDPLIKTFVTGQYSKTKGTIDDFSLNLEGKGFTRENMEKFFKGKLKIDLSNLSLPYQIGEYDLLYILLIPFEILVKLREMLPGGLRVKNLQEGIDSTKSIFVNKQNIDIEEGQIYMTAENGVVNLDKIHFAGGKNDAVKYSNFSGTIGVDGNLEIDANSNISSIRLPIDISGTIQKPEINYALFIPAFLAVNTANILNPMNIVDLLIDTGKGVSNTVIGTGKLIAKPFEKNNKTNRLMKRKTAKAIN